jgi:hypothetical protein
VKNRLTASQHFGLPVRAWVDDILLLGGLGVEDTEFADQMLRCSFCGVAPKGESDNIKNTCLSVTFASLFPLEFFWYVASGLQK